ncbi:MAG: aldo/keto reductase [Planctomycetia bacterium]|nr:aldo/keto reductase [Planctomycetia bacterium]
MKRRQFLEQALTGLGVVTADSLLLGSSWGQESAANGAELPFSTDPVALVRLTDEITTSRIGLGTGVCASMRQCNLTKMDKDVALDLIRFCYDSGIRYYDMADLYNTHGLVAEALAGRPRDSYTLGSKVWCHAGGLPEEERPLAEVSVERFLKELKTDYLDLVQLHCMSNEHWEAELADQMESLERLKKRGLIRAHGVSCHAISALSKAAVNPWVDTIHARLNTADTRMDGSWDDNVAVLQTARANGKGIIIMKILGEGSIKDPEERRKSTDAVTRLECKNVMIVGFEKREHVTEFLDNVAATLKDMELSRKATVAGRRGHNWRMA